MDHQSTPAPARSVSILGATGSIGASTIDLIKRERSRYRVEALSANTNASALAALARELNARFAAIADPKAYEELKAALAGSGIAWLPESACVEELRSGRLRQVLPEWGLPQGILHIVYPSRRGMLPAVRALVDFLVEVFEHPSVADAH